MPIYAYRCESCGFADDVLQRMSDPVLTDCPTCGKATFRKQVTAAGFQLKGSGWYVTDFREGGSNTTKAKPAPAGGENAAAAPAADAGTPAAAAPAGSATPAAGAPAAAPAAPAATPSAAPSTGSGGNAGA